jgi:hypothetical protein
MVSKAVYKAEASENSRGRADSGDDQESLEDNGEGLPVGGVPGTAQSPLPQHEWQDESEGIL